MLRTVAGVIDAVSALSDPAAVRDRLEHWARAHYDGGATVPQAWPMPGNAGLSFGFDVVDGRGTTWPLVIRLSPPGVLRRGNTDVLRQVPLLATLAEAGVPVARVTWASGDAAWFGTDALVQERLTAWPLHLWEPRLSHPAAAEDVGPFLDQAVVALAAIHRTPWKDSLGDWEPMRTIASEVEFWSQLLARSGQPALARAGGRLGEDLLARQPADLQLGIFHGDYQTNNVLYAEAGDLVAVIDWEISGLGPQLLDLGWLALFTDPSCWDAGYAAGMQVVAEPATLRHRYEDAAQAPVDSFDFFRAFACYRFGVIAAFNLRLHRTGRRVDASYDRIAPSVPTLFERGRELVAGGRVLHE